MRVQSEREKMIAQRARQGFINRDIADKACTSVRTVDVHRAKMMTTLSVNSLAELGCLLKSNKTIRTMRYN
ncbi:LuxR C-terminal-related transcriptional regulator [Yersinia aldovae]|uniref:Tetrathionate reductase complex: two-component system response regulator n=1 Tax=Yersinia aldovae TaxID=29483 RepID=A0A0T9U9Y5_YERAL|nr:LuxR C-terminal-related transcriptional regulator [Yersinia aldovae]EEP96726.1 Tetrathionate reductase complex: two-component system response regulator [Yersinia aldovae ATCC 35236]CNJ96289.1 tetrathionate reductase complex: two-component system response regulator [Yersinia aldovae]CNL10500.1 tetrathionate reductase complex: two-component system response regulator [Yersinia aldovae]CNL28476.1 tetrathionate reductase complex: two-component system response regulator [Yersinia aldovae]